MCVNTERPFNHIRARALPSFLHIMHHFVHLCGLWRNYSQIPPYRTQRGILLVSISRTDPPEALHNNA